MKELFYGFTYHAEREKLCNPKLLRFRFRYISTGISALPAQWGVLERRRLKVWSPGIYLLIIVAWKYGHTCLMQPVKGHCTKIWHLKAGSGLIQVNLLWHLHLITEYWSLKKGYCLIEVKVEIGYFKLRSRFKAFCHKIIRIWCIKLDKIYFKKCSRVCDRPTLYHLCTHFIKVNIIWQSYFVLCKSSKILLLCKIQISNIIISSIG